MNINYHHLIPQDFDDDSRVWIYQSNRAFTIREGLQIKKLLQNFTEEWKNDIPLKCYANLFFRQFIILMFDKVAPSSMGSCTGHSIRLIKNIEKNFHVEIFDRLMLAFIVEERIHVLPLSKINNYLENGLVTNDTLYFNNTILTKKELVNNWVIPVKKSWLALRIGEKEYLQPSMPTTKKALIAPLAPAVIVKLY